MEMIQTVEEFKNQNAYWCDDYYHYAIHKTDGGAVYLFQVDGPLTDDSIKHNMVVIRLDGCDVDMLIKNIKEVL